LYLGEAVLERPAKRGETNVASPILLLRFNEDIGSYKRSKRDTVIDESGRGIFSEDDSSTK